MGATPMRPFQPLAAILVVAAAGHAAPLAAAEFTVYGGGALGYGAQAINQPPLVIPPVIIGPGEEIPGRTFPRDIEGSDLALQAFAGVRLHRYAAVEVGYVDLGSVSSLTPALTEGGQLTQVSDSVDTTGRELMLVGVWPVNRDFEAFGKLGLFSWDADRATAGVAGAQLDGNDVAFGLGLDYLGTGRLRFRIQGMQYNLKGFDESIAVTVGAFYALPVGR